MQYFDYLSDCDLSSLFFKPPEAFFKTTERETLRLAVGGLLYTPAFNRQIARSIINGNPGAYLNGGLPGGFRRG